MGIMLWDMPPGWGVGSTTWREEEKARRAELQRKAAERAAELLEAGVQPPTELEDRVRFIEAHGARVYLAMMGGSTEP